MEVNEIEKKKDFLYSYRRYGIKIKKLVDKLEELKINKISPSSGSDGMPHGSGVTDLSDYAAEIERLEYDIEVLKKKRRSVYRKIKRKISSMQNCHEQNILKLKYLKGKDWEKIVVNTGKTYRQVIRIHGNALQNFPLKIVVDMSHEK